MRLWVGIDSKPTLLTLLISALHNTPHRRARGNDARSVSNARLRHEAVVLDYYRRLRMHYYPKLYRYEAFNIPTLNERPAYLARGGDNDEDGHSTWLHSDDAAQCVGDGAGG